MIVLDGRRARQVINVITVAKCALILFLVVAGLSLGVSSHETGNAFWSSTDAFFPEGAAGVVKGTSMLFFGFIGFDEVCPWLVPRLAFWLWAVIRDYHFMITGFTGIRLALNNSIVIQCASIAVRNGWGFQGFGLVRQRASRPSQWRRSGADTYDIR